MKNKIILLCIFSIIPLVCIFLTNCYRKNENSLSDKNYIKTVLSKMVSIDQALRAKVAHAQSTVDESLWNEIKKIDREHTKTLKEILNYYYWITIPEFGKEADGHAWLLVQHADHDPEFQKEALHRLEKLYPSQETSPTNFAYLHDRVAKNEKRPQRYGTQGTVKDGKWVPYEIEDPNSLDYRRSVVGLPSFQEYLKLINEVYH